ncbi:hypothetical protein AHAS_Ahas19G0256900 [Arachis hypogaea]
MKRLRLSLRGSCGGKGEEKGGGGTSGQGHSSEVETHDPESAASFLSSSFQYPVVKIGTEDQSFIDYVIVM